MFSLSLAHASFTSHVSSHSRSSEIPLLLYTRCTWTQSIDPFGWTGCCYFTSDLRHKSSPMFPLLEPILAPYEALYCFTSLSSSCCCSLLKMKIGSQFINTARLGPELCLCQNYFWTMSGDFFFKKRSVLYMLECFHVSSVEDASETVRTVTRAIKNKRSTETSCLMPTPTSPSFSDEYDCFYSELDSQVCYLRLTFFPTKQRKTNYFKDIQTCNHKTPTKLLLSLCSGWNLSRFYWRVLASDW